MDLSNAFYTMDHRILIRKLKAYEVRGIIFSWFKDNLRNRHKYVIFKSTTSNISTVECGVPQGYLRSLTVLLVYMNDIYSRLAGAACERERED